MREQYAQYRAIDGIFIIKVESDKSLSSASSAMVSRDQSHGYIPCNPRTRGGMRFKNVGFKPFRALIVKIIFLRLLQLIYV